jgi:hypothetical protein
MPRNPATPRPRPTPPRSTPDARAAGLARAHARTRAINAAAPDLKQDWLDSDQWRSMARERGLNLPLPQYRPHGPALAKWLRKLNVSKSEFLIWGGYETLADFERLNPRTPLWAVCGFLLEYVEERDAAGATLRSRLNKGVVSQ